jgi:hypothetical protein
MDQEREDYEDKDLPPPRWKWADVVAMFETERPWRTTALLLGATCGAFLGWRFAEARLDWNHFRDPFALRTNQSHDAAFYAIAIVCSAGGGAGVGSRRLAISR